MARWIQALAFIGGIAVIVMVVGLLWLAFDELISIPVKRERAISAKLRQALAESCAELEALKNGTPYRGPIPPAQGQKEG